MGKASKHRQCPALGREISRSECGESRHSRCACPPTCPHNPFALEHYTALLSTEDELDARTMTWLFEEARDRVGLERGMEEAARSKSGHGLHAFCMWNLFFRRDELGLTCAERWGRAGFPGLNNDERVFIQSKMQVRVILLEVHRVLDDQRVEGVDLLAPDAPPMIIVDRSLAARVPRFGTLLAWAYPLPHFWRLGGTAIYLPDTGPFDPLDVVNETIRHLGGPLEGAALRVWLAEHFVLMDRSMTAMAQERRRQMFAGMDVQFGHALYVLQAPFAECRAVLDAEPEVARAELTDEDPDEGFAEARDWFDDTIPASPGRRLLGRLLLGQARWRLEATGAARLATLRERFERRLGQRVRFERELREDFGARMAGEISPLDQSLVPPRLLEQPRQMELSASQLPVTMSFGSKADIETGYMAGFLRDYPDHPVPALDGKTPRQAARDPSLRKKLVELLKAQIRQIDETNLRTRRTVDINRLLRELGLTEIDFPPPPPRTPPPKEPDDLGEYLDEEEAEGEPPRPAAPPLPPVPLDMDEVEERLRESLAGFETAASAMAELTASGSTLLDDMAELTEGALSDDEFSFFVTIFLHGWFALVPPGARAPELDFDAMEEALECELASVPSWAVHGPDNVMSSLTAGCRQPALLQLLMAEIFAGATKAPKKIRPKPESMIPMVVNLKVMINEVDRALRAAPR